MNHLITLALSHGVDSLEYMSKLKNVDVFRFCAIPQVMAIATLAECYDNGKVFEGVVKIRRGLSARIMLNCLDIFDVAVMFKQYTQVIKSKVRSEDPSAKTTLRNLEKIDSRCDEIIASDVHGFRHKHDPDAPLIFRVIMWLLAAMYVAYAFQLCGVREAIGLAPAATGIVVLDNAEKFLATVAVAATTIFLLTGQFF